MTTVFYTNAQHYIVTAEWDGTSTSEYRSQATGQIDPDGIFQYATRYTQVFTDSAGGRITGIQTADYTDFNHPQLTTINYDNSNVPVGNALFRHGPISFFQSSDGHGNSVTQQFISGRLYTFSSQEADGSFNIQTFDANSKLVSWDNYDADGFGSRTSSNSEFHQFFNGEWLEYLWASQVFHPETTAQAANQILTDARSELADVVHPLFQGGAFGASVLGLDYSNISARLIINPGATLIGHDGATLIGHDGATLIGQDGAGLIGDGGGTIAAFRLAPNALIGDGGGTLQAVNPLIALNLIGLDAASIITDNGAGLLGMGLIGDGGGTLIGDGGGTLRNLSAVANLSFSVHAASVISNDGAGNKPLDGENGAATFSDPITGSGNAYLTNLSASMINLGRAIDGYVANAIVFADANENGVYDVGEDWTVTDSAGSFVLYGAGSAVMAGGTDTGTGQNFSGMMTSPFGADVVTPLTTILLAVIANGGNQEQVKQALGLDPSLDLTDYDAIASLLAGDSPAAEYLQQAFSILNYVFMCAYALDGASDEIDLRTAAQQFITSLALYIIEHGSIDLTQPFQILALFGFFGQEGIGDEGAEGAEGAVGGFDSFNLEPGFLDSLANVVAGANGSLAQAVQSGATGQALLTQLNGVQTDAQGATLTELRNAAGNPALVSVIEVGANDVLSGDGGANTLNGFGGDDLIFGDAGGDVLNGGTGADTILGQDGDDTVGGDAGNDRINAGGGDDTVFGGAGNDEIGGGSGNDIMVGQDGDDVIFGEEGNDIANAGAGADVMIGGLGNDTFGGGSENDIIIGGDGDDLMFGEDGVGNINGEFGADGVVGGAGNDILGGGAGNDIVVGDDGDDVLFGETGNDAMNGGFGNDILIGSDGDDVIGGGAGDDDLNGGFGNDTLFGENGNDILNGGAGNDVLIGGGNDDVFVFGPGDGADTIADFFVGAPEDRIWFVGTDLHSFADVQSHATTVSGNAVITYNSFFTITLNGVTAGQLASGDFIFS